VPTCYRHPDRESYIRCQRCERTICPDCMRDAAVGFQCPTCVAEGARSTRQGRAPYGGTRSANRALTSLVLVGLNVAVWLAITATGGRASALLDRLGLVVGERCDPVGQAGYYPQVPSEALCTTQVNGSWVTGVADGAWWQLLTSAFTHVEIWHIAVNMLALWFLGPQVERTLGRVRYLALYLLSALAGSTLVLWFTPSLTQTVGASGAIFGLMGALLVLAHKVGGNVSQIGGWLLINAVITFTFPNISWQGHLGGFLGGALVAALLVYSPRQRRGLWQLIGLGTFSLFLLAALVVRVAALS
jgi:membrane associated rhomboid family serine protease